MPLPASRFVPLLAVFAMIVAVATGGGIQDLPLTVRINAQPLQRAASWLLRGAARNPNSKPLEQTMAEARAENDWKNDVVLAAVPAGVRSRLPRLAQTWLRCWLACMVLYFGVGALWCYYCYWCFGSRFYKAGEMPALRDCLEQIAVSFRAMPLYSMLPTLTEYCVEQGWTMAYTRVSDVGLPRYLLYLALYMTSVEFFVYWMHRMLHSGWGYRKLHAIHHKYNKGHTLGPFSGLAFHPLDGILQAIPYSWTLLYVPMHFLTHELLLFTTAIWTTNIHDNIHAKIAPIMGAGYHTIHHTRYVYNYGHYFTFMDRLFGTLLTPEREEELMAERRTAGQAARVAAQKVE